MIKKQQFVWFLLAVAAVYCGVALELGTVFAQVRTPDNRNTNTPVLADAEVKRLLVLMDTDKNGKISKEEFMKFMEAEFNRLDKDKSGELDPKELTQSQVRPSPTVGK